MKTYLPLLLLLISSCTPKEIVKNDNNSEKFDKTSLVENFIKIIKSSDAIKLSKQTLFPIKRRHPLPDVADRAAFLLRFNEIFDEEFRTMIVNSDPEKDWADVGSKGIMFLRGKLWIDFSGQLFAINYQSAEEKKQAAAILMKQNTNLHESVRVFEKPVMDLTTESYKIRIDNLGSYNYRYAAWPIDKQVLSKPDIIVENGERIPEGSGGSSRFVFKNGDYRYEVMTIKLGPKDAPPAILFVYKGNKKILEQDVIVLND